MNVAIARAPALRTFEFIPSTTHVVAPLVLEQVTLLPPAVALDPAAIVTLATREGE